MEQPASAIHWDEYRDPLGLLGGKRNPTEPESNAVLFSACERTLRLRLGTWEIIDQVRLDAEVAHLVQGGRLTRPEPWTQDEERPDNHIGLGGTGSKSACAAVLLHFDSNPFYLSGFKFRFPAIIAHLEWAAGKTPALWRRLYWFGSFLVSGDSEHQDPWIQGFLLLETAPDSWVKRMAEAVYWWRLRRNWPGGLAQVFERYFSAEHPCTLACRDLWI